MPLFPQKGGRAAPAGFRYGRPRRAISRGANLNMPDEALVKRLEARLPDQFSRDLLKGALAALTQENVATRAQHFSVSMRNLSDHMLKQLAVDDEPIKKCPWYEQHPKVEGPPGANGRCTLAGRPDRLIHKRRAQSGRTKIPPQPAYKE
jgi:hypothetical protein